MVARHRARRWETSADDPIENVHRPDHDVTVAVVFRAMALEPDPLPRFLVADALTVEEKESARRRVSQ